MKFKFNWRLFFIIYGIVSFIGACFLTLFVVGLGSAFGSSFTILEIIGIFAITWLLFPLFVIGGLLM